ncbi:uncharacterized protein LOC117124732 [Anneissia japonica]|uniref:uncharacterized protein LOC117124732 n=1 Tax=Anneissia japonica TaxID=1529436 RepID=UPI001425B993|nr:uncharacterized protein LOC117124732 [Anneissia japonica]
MRESLMISARNVNLQDEDKETPLHILLEAKHKFRDHLDIARLLLDAGADVNIKNEHNQTPCDLYIENKCEEYGFRNRKKHKNEVLQLLQDFRVPEVILARGSEALKVFNEELQEGSITVNHARLMVTGKEGVGKTCLVNTLLERTFNEEEPSTDGIVLTTAFQTTDISSVWKEAEDMDECDRIKDIFDNALESKVAEKLKQKGSQVEAAEPVQASAGKSTPVPPLVHAPKKSNVFVRVFQRLTKKDGRRKPVTSSTPVLPSVPVPVEVNDPSQALPSERQKRIIDRMFGKASASTSNEDMTYIWDFAGQQLYYITHRIFLTSEAVYLILFNLMEGMHDKGKCRVSRMEKQNVMTYDMTNVQIIKYWMRLIYTYAVPVESPAQATLQAKKPQIVVVGTHGESLQGTAEDKKKKIEEQFGIIFEEIEGTPYGCHVVRKMYAIDNKFPTQSEMLTTLKQDVGEFLNAMPKTIPLKWLEFQRILQENGRTAVRMSYSKVCNHCLKC